MIYSENSKIQRYIPSGRLYESLKIEINNALEMPRKYRLGKTNIEIYGKEKALEISRKLSISKKGKPSHNLGRKFPPEFGQNISKRRTGTKMSDEAKKRRSERQMGENNPFFGKTHTPETKQKISDANSGDKHCFYGKHFTEEHKKAIGDAQRGKTVSRESIEKRKITIANNPKPYSEKRRQEMREFFTQNNPRSRKCSINNIEFKSMSEAARILNLSNKIIRNRILSDKNKWSEWILI
jgi:group I intron endonuclease